MGRRVLIVDDDEETLYAFATLLDAAGHEVHRASTGEQATLLAAAWAPDVVILDLGLPDVGAAAVVGALKRLPDPPFIVAFTGWHRLEAEALAAGCDAFVLKPSLDKVLAYVARYDRRQGKVGTDEPR